MCEDFTRLKRNLELIAEALMENMTNHYNKLMEGRKDWVSVEERLPPNDCSVLLAMYDSRPGVEMYFIEMGYRMNSVWHYGHDGSEIKKTRVTHWMPLPDKPGVLS